MDPVALLNELPVDEVPAPGNLLAGSRVLHFPNPHFVGRGKAFRQLATALRDGTAAVVNQNITITGSGGIGKTQLAAEVAWRYGPFFAGGVFWLSFANPASVPTEIAACGLKLRLHPQFSTLAVADQVALVQWHWEGEAPCLLIFDNCEDPALFRKWRPRVGPCRVVVTSRCCSWDGAPSVTSLALSTLPRAESQALLAKHRPDLAGRAILDALAGELGDFPLALHLAGSYLKKYRTDPARYLENLGSRDPLAHVSLTDGKTATDHDPNVARTFAEAVDRLVPSDIVDSTAVSALTHAAFLAPDEPVPVWLLARIMGQEEDEAFHNRLMDAVTRLRDLGLVDVDPDCGAPILHRLITNYARQRAEDRTAVWESVADAVQAVAEEQNQQGLPVQLLAWQAHLRYVAEFAVAKGDDRAGMLLSALGFHLDMIAEYRGAKKAYEQAQTVWEAALGGEHPNVATALTNLGQILRVLGDVSGARASCERALAIDEVNFGKIHPKIAIRVNEIGGVLEDLGDLMGARSAYERALAISKATLGPNHPHVATYVNNLGGVERGLGNLRRAQAAFEQALVIGESAFGSGHPNVAVFVNNLGITLLGLGEYRKAQLCLERALMINERFFGVNHPSVAINVCNIGTLSHTLRDFSGARAGYERAEKILRRALGLDHSMTRSVRRHLASLPA